MSMQPGLFAHLVPFQQYTIVYKNKSVSFNNEDENNKGTYISPDNPWFVDLIVEAVYESGMFSEKELDEFSVIDDDDLAKLVKVL